VPAHVGTRERSQVMDQVSEYRAKRKRTMQMARSTADPRIRTILVNCARNWQQLANMLRQNPALAEQSNARKTRLGE